MELQQVQSSSISKLGYEPLTRKMVVVFNTGSIYEFSNIEEEIFNSLLNSPSMGTFFHKNIKNRYLCKKVV